MGDAVDAVEPGCAHGARFGLSLSILQVIDDERAIGLREEFAEMCGAHRNNVLGLLGRPEVARALCKRIVLDRSALGKMAPQLGDAFTLAHEFDFGETKLLASG